MTVGISRVTSITHDSQSLRAASGQDARAGDLVVCAVDCALGTDGSVPMALDYFKAMGGEIVRDPGRLVFALDHYVPPTSTQTIGLHRVMRDFAQRFGITLHEAGEGIGHQLMVETGRALPGGLVVGADSHAVTYGALNCFATGIGSSDLAAIMLCGRIWLRVPESIRVVLTGQLPSGVYAKDIALALAGMLGADGAAYQALEFAGPGVATLALEDRLVLSNLAVEMGAKTGMFPADAETVAYLQGRTGQAFEPVAADPDAHYSRTVEIALDALTPRIALPHLVDQVEDPCKFRLQLAAGLHVPLLEPPVPGGSGLPLGSDGAARLLPRTVRQRRGTESLQPLGAELHATRLRPTQLAASG